MTQSMNIDSNSSQAIGPSPSIRYSTDSVDFGSKYTSNIKLAYRNEEPWAKAIIDAEKSPLSRPKYLNSRGFAKNSLYGAMHDGLRIGTRFTSPDPTVRETLQEWARNLNHDFGPMKSYTPDQLAQRVANLDAVVGILNIAVNDLAQSGETSSEDTTTWRRIIEGLQSYRDGADRLRQVLRSGPGIDVVYLDIDPKQH